MDGVKINVDKAKFVIKKSKNKVIFDKIHLDGAMSETDETMSVKD